MDNGLDINKENNLSENNENTTENVENTAENTENAAENAAENAENTSETSLATTDTAEAVEETEKKKRGAVVATVVGLAKFIWWLLRMLWKLLRGMWRHKIVSAVVMALIAAAVVALLVVRCMNESDSPLNLEVGINNKIDKTPTLLTEVKKIGQWEFLSISDEEMIDTIRKGFFSDDELIRIYYGTLRLGIDFAQCEDNWARMDGDSLVLNLPPVRLLDENFLDETRTQSFIETGSWSGSDRQDMADRAREAMRRRCLTAENMTLAQQNAERQLREFFEKVINKK